MRNSLTMAGCFELTVRNSLTMADCFELTGPEGIIHIEHAVNKKGV